MLAGWLSAGVSPLPHRGIAHYSLPRRRSASPSATFDVHATSLPNREPLVSRVMTAGRSSRTYFRGISSLMRNDERTDERRCDRRRNLFIINRLRPRPSPSILFPLPFHLPFAIIIIAQVHSPSSAPNTSFVSHHFPIQWRAICLEARPPSPSYTKIDQRFL